MRREYIAWFDMPNNSKLHGQSVMPQQELIRCKDCKHCMDGNICTHNIFKQAIEVYADDFCSRAERKEE